MNPFIDAIAPLAMKYARNLYPSVTIAQACLESGWGQSTLATLYHNVFGVKAGPSWKGPITTMQTKEDPGNGQLVTVQAGFKVFDHLEASVKDHEALFDTEFSQSFYRKALDAQTPEEQCQALQGTYATDTGYAKKLIDLIDQYNLKYYDNHFTKDSKGGGNNSMGINLETAINYMYGLKNRGVTYSMNRSRTGADGTGDCSGTIYAALRAGGASNLGWIPNTDSMHAWLLTNGFKCIAENQEWQAKRGDVVIFGKKGASGGASGHVVLFISNTQIIHCTWINDRVNGVFVNDEATTCPYDMGWYVYRLDHPVTTQATRPIDEVIKEVLAGKWGNGSDRSAKLRQAGYNPEDIQKRVNAQIIGSATQSAQRVTIANYATHWQTGEPILPKVKGKSYVVSKTKAVNQAMSKKAYLLKEGNEYVGWLLEQDVVGFKAPAQEPPRPAATPKQAPAPEKQATSICVDELTLNGVKYVKK